MQRSSGHGIDYCTECGACVSECRFLQQYGTPKQIAETFDPSVGEHQTMPFECSLCGLCSAVCPSGLSPDAMFLDMRRALVKQGLNDLTDYAGLLGYERRGTSRRYTWYGLPAGCDTVFFPGCAFSGTRPDQTKRLFDIIAAMIPNLGIVFDCCTKPSLSLGRQDYFNAMFGELKDYLLRQGVETVLVACPNCFKVFAEYAPELTVRTVYEVLERSNVPAGVREKYAGTVTVHDPCVSRFSKSVQSAARSLVARAGFTIEEMPSSGRYTVCCGEGGAVACLDPDMAEEWSKKRMNDSEGRRTITYCAGCTHLLSKRMPTSHVIDLVLDPDAALAGKAKVSNAPFTYLNRLRLKRYFQAKLAAAVTRERIFTSGAEKKRGGFSKPLAILAVLAALIALVRITGASQYLEQEKLRSLIQGYGALAPIIYMLVYAVAPSLFLPGLPITIAGGVLFGPIWGVVYTIVGATIGASIAFLVARYIARDWVNGKLRGPRWKKLDREVEKQGWKMVAFTRLVPLFPFNLLNYAFGLTSVRFGHYVIATFAFMLPACIAFIVFSSSLLDVLKGRISPSLIAGLGLVAMVSAIPVFLRQYKRRQDLKEAATKVVDARDNKEERPFDIGKRLKVKLLIFSTVLGAALLAVLLARYYFWAINAYVYTLEFNVLFILNRLRDGNLILFADYLQPMSEVRGLIVMLSGHILQGFWSPFSHQVLVPAGDAAFGALRGFLFNFIGMMAAGFMAFGAGRFLLGDIIPALEVKRNGPLVHPAHMRKTAALVPLLAAVPWLPLSLVAGMCGLFNVPYRRIAVVLVIGVVIRLLSNFMLF